jgi:hypothetical protein
VQLFQAAVFTISRMAAAVACLTLLYMVGHILYEIVLRYAFASSTFVLDEFVGYAVAATTFMALGYSLEHGSLIRVNLVIGRTSGRARRALEAISAIRDGELGRVEPGYRADLIVVEGNPLEDIKVLADPQRPPNLVLKDGAIVANRL